MEYPGVEPGAFYMRGKRDTTTPISQLHNFFLFLFLFIMLLEYNFS